MTIRDCLEQRKADVTELYQPLSPSMNEIQQAIIECIEACLSEIKKGNGSWASYKFFILFHWLI